MGEGRMGEVWAEWGDDGPWRRVDQAGEEGGINSDACKF